MKTRSFHKPVYQIAAGIVGLLVCVLLYVIAYRIEAPNESTLIYRQSWMTLSMVILALVSITVLIRGIWLGIQLRRTRDLEK